MKIIQPAACFIFLLILFFSCKKIDTVQPSRLQPAVAENRFFTAHTSAGPVEKQLVDYMKRQNNKLHFVEKTVAQIGYPYWNKMLTISNGRNAIETEGTVNDTSTYYIPFVRDSQNYVNAALAIQTTSTDTSFYYLCDWQYSGKPYGSPLADSSAERYAWFFMMMDNRTLGHTRFKITDSSLFAWPGHVMGSGRVIGIADPGDIGIESLICAEYYYCGTPDANECFNGCDYMSCPSGECFLWGEVCSPPPGGGGGGDGGSGGLDPGPPGGGGGGGSGGGGTPPPCGGPSEARGNLPCTPGWEPEPPVPTPPPNKSPCDKMLPVKNQADSGDVLQFLWNTVGNTDPNYKREFGVSLYSNRDPQMQTGPLIDNYNIPSINFSSYSGLLGIIHTHPNHTNQVLPIFSPGDFLTAYHILKAYNTSNVKITQYTHFFTGMINWKGDSYFMVIDNIDAFNNFAKRLDFDNFPVQNDELEKRFNAYGITNSSSVAQTEKLFLQFLLNNNCGVRLLKSDHNFTQFSELKIQGQEIIAIPCP